MNVLDPATITNYHRVDGLNNKHLFLIFLDAGKSKIKVLAGAVSGRSLLPGVQMGIFLYPHIVENRDKKQAFLL